jgi:predicted nucleic acid-binding protein
MRSANESRRRILIDTNVLIALINGAHPAHESVEAQLAELQAEGHALIVAPQCVYEFWVVATRPVVNNGLGKSPAEANELLEQILNTFQQYDDPPSIVDEWRRLCVSVSDCRQARPRRPHRRLYARARDCRAVDAE